MVSRQRLLKIWCVYGLLGPLIGAAVGWIELSLGFLLVPVKSSVFPDQMAIVHFLVSVNAALAVIPFAIFFGLLWGLPFSALTGVAMVAMTSAGRQIRLIEALSVASSVYLLVFAGMYAYAYFAYGLNDLITLRLSTFNPLFLVRYPRFTILPVLAATAICWSLSGAGRRRFCAADRSPFA